MMIDVKPGARGLSALAVSALALLPSVVSAQGIPKEYTDLEILPEGIQRAELVGIMQYYGRGAFDLGQSALATVAQTLGRENPEVGMAAVELNLEYHPESIQTWILKGQLHLLAEETDDAITALERALELSPGNTMIEQLLRRARGDLQG